MYGVGGGGGGEKGAQIQAENARERVHHHYDSYGLLTKGAQHMRGAERFFLVRNIASNAAW